MTSDFEKQVVLDRVLPWSNTLLFLYSHDDDVGPAIVWNQLCHFLFHFNLQVFFKINSFKSHFYLFFGKLFSNFLFKLNFQRCWFERFTSSKCHLGHGSNECCYDCYFVDFNWKSWTENFDAKRIKCYDYLHYGPLDLLKTCCEYLKKTTSIFYVHSGSEYRKRSNLGIVLFSKLL